MYLEAQGLRADPYRVLQLDPAAPRDLIVEVYWMLVSRTRRHHLRQAPGDDLGAAYAAIINAKPAASTPAIPLAGGHYAVLRVDPGADAGVINAAHSFLVRNGDRMKSSERGLIREAYRVLSNPKLRAQYDALRDTRARSAPSIASSVPTPVGVATSVDHEAARRLGVFSRSLPTAVANPAAERLLGLRKAAVASLPYAAPRTPRDTLADATAEVVFLAGPRAGLRVPLDGRATTLGGDPADTVPLESLEPSQGFQIWQQGDQFLLREHAPGKLRIGGRALTLPLMVLDDGDEIVLGPHDMRFRRVPPG